MKDKIRASIGIDIDNQSIRAARIIKTGSSRGVNLSALTEIEGDFAKDDAITEGLKKIRQKLSISPNDSVVTCLGGKQTWAAEMSFRKLPDEELRTALKFEIRKNLPFEVSSSTLEYQFLRKGDKKDNNPLIVTAVSNLLLNRHLRITGNAGINPRIVDVLPLALANACSAGSDQGSRENIRLVLHIGPEFSTLVIDGQNETFYNRTIYFSAGEVFGSKKDETLPQREQERRVSSFIEEISRTLSYYGSNFGNGKFSELTILGSFLHSSLLDSIFKQTGLTTRMLDLVRTFRPGKESVPGKFDLALTLALRNSSQFSFN